MSPKYVQKTAKNVEGVDSITWVYARFMLRYNRFMLQKY